MTGRATPDSCIVIVTATRVESSAVIQVFQSITGQETKLRFKGGQGYFELGHIHKKRVVLIQSEMGSGTLGGSTQAVSKAIAAFSPEAVIMVGIAFGISEQKQKIGDVLISQQLRPYELQRVGMAAEQQQIILRDDKPRASPQLMSLFKGADLMLDYDPSLVWENPPARRFGVILTGEKLVDNIDFRDQLLNLEVEAIGGEMEGKGLYLACHDNKVDWILVKAICDWADGNKAENKAVRQQLAAENAARFVAYALQFASEGDEEVRTDPPPPYPEPPENKPVEAPPPTPEVPTPPPTIPTTPKPQSKSVLTYRYEYVRLDSEWKLFGTKGRIIERNQGLAEYYSEDLGNGVTLEMTAIPGGSFQMGGAEYDNEQPIHEVSVKPFWMGKFTVTQEQWARVAKLSKVQIDLNPDPARFKGANRPVEKVNWHEAIEFCARLSKHTGKQYRLPSEAEWEYACRAGTKTHYHFGDVISAAVANYDARAKYCWNGSPEGEYRKQTTPVGNFPANPWGLYEMHGNVWEWCADPWHESYQNAPTNGRVWDSGNEHHYQNITRNIDYLLKSQHPRVLRGGSWLYNPWNCRSALCGSSIPANRHYSVSFRVSCARPKTF